MESHEVLTVIPENVTPVSLPQTEDMSSGRRASTRSVGSRRSLQGIPRGSISTPLQALADDMSSGRRASASRRPSLGISRMSMPTPSGRSQPRRRHSVAFGAPPGIRRSSKTSNSVGRRESAASSERRLSNVSTRMRARRRSSGVSPKAGQGADRRASAGERNGKVDDDGFDSHIGRLRLQQARDFIAEINTASGQILSAVAGMTDAVSSLHRLSQDLEPLDLPLGFKTYFSVTASTLARSQAALNQPVYDLLARIQSSWTPILKMDKDFESSLIRLRRTENLLSSEATRLHETQELLRAVQRDRATERWAHIVSKVQLRLRMVHKLYALHEHAMDKEAELQEAYARLELRRGPVQPSLGSSGPPSVRRDGTSVTTDSGRSGASSSLSLSSMFDQISRQSSRLESEASTAPIWNRADSLRSMASHASEASSTGDSPSHSLGQLSLVALRPARTLSRSAAVPSLAAGRRGFGLGNLSPLSDNSSDASSSSTRSLPIQGDQASSSSSSSSDREDDYFDFASSPFSGGGQAPRGLTPSDPSRGSSLQSASTWGRKSSKAVWSSIQAAIAADQELNAELQPIGSGSSAKSTSVKSTLEDGASKQSAPEKEETAGAPSPFTRTYFNPFGESEPNSVSPPNFDGLSAGGSPTGRIPEYLRLVLEEGFPEGEDSPTGVAQQAGVDPASISRKLTSISLRNGLPGAISAAPSERALTWDDLAGVVSAFEDSMAVLVQHYQDKLSGKSLTRVGPAGTEAKPAVATPQRSSAWPHSGLGRTPRTPDQQRGRGRRPAPRAGRLRKAPAMPQAQVALLHRMDANAAAEEAQKAALRRELEAAEHAKHTPRSRRALDGVQPGPALPGAASASTPVRPAPTYDPESGQPLTLPASFLSSHPVRASPRRPGAGRGKSLPRLGGSGPAGRSALARVDLYNSRMDG